MLISFVRVFLNFLGEFLEKLQRARAAALNSKEAPRTLFPARPFGATGSSASAASVPSGSSKPFLATPALPALVESPAAEAATSASAQLVVEAEEALAEAEGALAAATAAEEEESKSEATESVSSPEVSSTSEAVSAPIASESTSSSEPAPVVVDLTTSGSGPVVVDLTTSSPAPPQSSSGVSTPAASGTGIVITVGNWNLSCVNDGELTIVNSDGQQQATILKEDLPGFVFQSNRGTKHTFTAETSLGPEFAAGWAGGRGGKTKRLRSKMEAVKQKVRTTAREIYDNYFRAAQATPRGMFLLFRKTLSLLTS